MISFMKVSEEYSRILFRFNMQIITIIKTIPGFRYKNKMWFIPNCEINGFLQKVDPIVCEIEENNSKKQKVEQQLDYNEEETRHVFEESLQEKNNKKKPNQLEIVVQSDEYIRVILPVSKFIYAKLHNYKDLLITKKMSERRFWMVIGLQNIQKFYDCCEENNIEINKRGDDN